MADKKPIPRPAREVSQQQISPYTNMGKSWLKNKQARENQISVKDSKVKNFAVGLRDIDESIMYYFNEVIKPTVIQNGGKLNVPIIYGSPERWKSVQADGYYRDKEGRIQVPLIMFKRNSIEKNRSLGNKLDGNQVNNYMLFKTKYNKRNFYDRFSVLGNRQPSQELAAVVIPDYVTIQYDCILFTDYVEQMNKLIEAVNFASDSYWGDPERFKFRARIDTYTTVTELNTGQDRAVKTNFSITLHGYIISDTINKELANTDLVYSTAQVNFGVETAGDLEELETRFAADKEASTSIEFFDNGAAGAGGSGVTAGQLVYLALQNTATASSQTATTATFANVVFASDIVPSEFPPISKKDFEIYINGQYIPAPQITSLIEDGNNNIVATFDTVALDYDILPQFEVVLVGKFKSPNE